MEAPVALVLTVLLVAPLAAIPDPDGPAAWRLVAYEGPILPEDRAALEASTDLPVEPVPPFGFLAHLTPRAAAALAARPEVASIRDVPADLTASRHLDGARDVRLVAFPGVDVDALAQELLAQGASSVERASATEPVLDVALGPLPLAAVTGHPATRWVERRPSAAELDNAAASGIVQGGAIDAWRLHEHGVDGSTQVVAYCDTGLDTDAPAASIAGRTVHEQSADPGALLVHNVPSPLHRKVALYYSPIDARGLRGDMDDADGHGTHVGGTLAGDAGAWGVRDGDDGVAYAARLAVCDAADARGFHLLADPSGYWQPAYDAGARVHSNSWGTPATDEYTLTARQHDAYAWGHRDLLIVRSVGNTGPDGLLRPEAVAKNVLAVGATPTDASPTGVSWFSGRGPAADGRVKPDLVAPGDCVRSAALASPTAYACLSGTSQATAVAAGAAALVRDYFAKGFHPSGVASTADAREVSSALVRAVLVASATPIAAPAPDGAQGWGRPHLARALPFAGDAATLLAHDEDAPLGTSETWTTTLHAEAGATLRIVLAWTDRPAALGASVALVNDLDLEVVTPSGAVLLGNADLAAPDRVNVLERVLVAGAEAGEHTIRVRGWNVPWGPQPFAVVVLAA